MGVPVVLSRGYLCPVWDVLPVLSRGEGIPCSVQGRGYPLSCLGGVPLVLTRGISPPLDRTWTRLGGPHTELGTVPWTSLGVPHPSRGQANKLKISPSRRTKCAGGKKRKMRPTEIDFEPLPPTPTNSGSCALNLVTLFGSLYLTKDGSTIFLCRYLNKGFSYRAAVCVYFPVFSKKNPQKQSH